VTSDVVTEQASELPDYPFATRDGVDPDPGYIAAMATGGPVQVDIGGGHRAWLMTRMADVRQVHTDARFSRAAAAAADGAPTNGLAPPAGSLLSLDAPDHTRVRGLVAGAFSARRVAALAPRIAARAAELVAAFPGDEPVDLVSRYARPLSVGVIGDLLGVPPADHEQFTDWADAFLSTAGGPETGRSRGALGGYVAQLLAAKAARPTGDLLSHLATQDGATRQELILLAVGVLVAGHETTSSHLASSLMLVLSDPAAAERLRGDRAAVSAAVEELLRTVSLGSVGGFPRMAVADVEVAGTVIREGDLVIAALNAANRDPAAFTEPDRMDLTRFAGSTAGHVGFGAGMHHCLGSALARLELAEGIAAVIEGRPQARPAQLDTQSWQRGSLVRGLVELPVLLGPERSRAS
jgi:cytochrome P450